MTEACKHENIKPEVIDQTVGIVCCDCHLLIEVCWTDRHFSEALWNRACLTNPDFIKCRLDRDNFCGLCGACMTDRSELIEDEDGAPLPESVQKLFRGMIAEIDRLLDEVKDLEAYSNLRYKADRRGIKMWQEAAPGRELMRPDHADLVVFLLERIDTLEKDRDGKLSK